MPGLLDWAADYGRGVVDRTKEMWNNPKGLLYQIFPSPEEGQARYNRLKGLLSGPETPEEQAYKRKLQDLAISQLTVYHGTPNKWAPEPGFPNGRPRMDKIGLGEGNQVYGHGVYFAENPAVAAEYAQKLAKNPSAVLKADLPDEVLPGLLNWDAPLSKQPAKVQKALSDYAAITGKPFDPALTGEQIYSQLMRKNAKFSDIGRVGAAEELRWAGVPGVSYLDEMSRDAGQGTRNFVIWDQDLLNRMTPQR